jgi:hypothetical protein
MIRSSFPNTVSAGLVVLLGVLGCNRSNVETVSDGAATGQHATARISSVSQPPGHQKMVAQLQRIAEQLRGENSYLGDSEVRKMRQLAATLAVGSGDAKSCNLRLQLGVSELRLGNETEAISQLTQAHELLASPDIRAAMGPEQSITVPFQLGVAYMRLAESLNCCQRNTPDSCIMPIQGEGIHTNQEPSRNAIRCFKEVLTNAWPSTPVHFRARWLLNIAYMTLGEYPDQVPAEYLIPPTAFESEESFPHFTNVSSRLGLDTFSLSGGAVADDFDGDDYIDLIVSTWEPSGQIRFFRNNGDGTFADRTIEAGLEGICGGLNMVQADYDNDGDIDFYVLRGAWLAEAGSQPNSLIRNNGDSTFTDVTFDAGVGDVHHPTQTASWADYDNDGDVDLYVGNEHGRGVVAPCQLFRNNGDGTFTDVAAVAGVANYRFAKAVIWGDYDHDRWPDLYVSNLGEENRLYRNLGDGTFRDVAEELGVTGPLGSFPAWFWDIDNDGVLDLYVSSYSNAVENIAASYVGTKMKMELAQLYRGNGKGGFDEVSQQWNLLRPATPMGSNFGDIDNDGFDDFYLGTGDPQYYNLMPNVMYHNCEGKGFADVTTAGGFGHLQKGHAVAFADFDNDGDLDIFEQLGGAFPGDKFHDALFENPGFGHNWIGIHLVGTRSNRSAIGASLRIDITHGGQKQTIYKHVNSGGTFGCNPLRQHVGLGDAVGVDRLEVFWPASGESQVFENLPVNRWIRIDEGQAQSGQIDIQPFHLGASRE